MCKYSCSSTGGKLYQCGKCVLKRLSVPDRLRNRIKYDFRESNHLQILTSLRYLYQCALRKIFACKKSRFELLPADQCLVDDELLAVFDQVRFSEQGQKYRKLHWVDFAANYRDLLRSPKLSDFNRK